MEIIASRDDIVRPALERENVKLVMALLLIPCGATPDWIAGQVPCRVTEAALCCGATEEQAKNWGAAWAELVEAVIASSAG